MPGKPSSPRWAKRPAPVNGSGLEREVTMSRDSRHTEPPPRYYPRTWPYLAAIIAVCVVMVALYLAIVL